MKHTAFSIIPTRSSATATLTVQRSIHAAAVHDGFLAVRGSNPSSARFLCPINKGPITEVSFVAVCDSIRIEGVSWNESELQRGMIMAKAMLQKAVAIATNA